MIFKRGKKGTYWMRFRFAGRLVHESARTTSKTLARDAERQRRRELETSGIMSSAGRCPQHSSRRRRNGWSRQSRI
jgi:hypothetical protein